MAELLWDNTYQHVNTLFTEGTCEGREHGMLDNLPPAWKSTAVGGFSNWLRRPELYTTRKRCFWEGLCWYEDYLSRLFHRRSYVVQRPYGKEGTFNFEKSLDNLLSPSVRAWTKMFFSLTGDQEINLIKLHFPHCHHIESVSSVLFRNIHTIYTCTTRSCTS